MRDLNLGILRQKIDVHPLTEDRFFEFERERSMRLLSVLIVVIFTPLCVGQSTQVSETAASVNLLPYPKEISKAEQTVWLSKQSKIYTSDPTLTPLLDWLASDIEKLTQRKLKVAETLDENCDVVFQLDASLNESEYHLNIGETVLARGGSYQSLAMAKTTLLQLVTFQEDRIGFPMVTVQDHPDAGYRGLMIDLARAWHPVDSIKKLIDVAAFYKSNYVHLHFTDYQSYTLPSREYPKLATEGKSYSFEELKELEAYSQLRGVTIIPEVDIPGHSSPFVEKYPEIFAIKDVKENPYIINMGKEEAYEALDVLIGELAEVFVSTPYFHIGGDEAYFPKVTDDPDVKAYMRKHELGDDVHDLYRHFIIRLNDTVKKHGKQMCVWEGFRREGKLDIPKDIVVFEFETNRYLPNHLVEDGYTVVNTSWKPLYVVNQKKWEPKTIYEWNVWRWENWFPKAPSIVPIQLEQTELIIGAQMCAWEQQEKVQVPSLRRRLPALNERIWNFEKTLSYEEFMQSMELKDQQLSLLIEDDRQDDKLLGHNFKAEDLEKK